MTLEAPEMNQEEVEARIAALEARNKEIAQPLPEGVDPVGNNLYQGEDFAAEREEYTANAREIERLRKLRS